MEVKIIHFYCESCRKDHARISFFQWLNSIVGMGWTAKCPDCKRKLVRLQDVNARHDPYFRKSKFIKGSLRRNSDYLLQPGDPRFDLLYPQHARAEAERLEAKQKEIWNKTKGQ